VHDKYKDDLSNPRMLELQDWKILEKAAHTLCLRICCIKPFNDGSNRIARLIENLVRLNVGLRFKVTIDKNDFLKEVQNLQDQEYKFE
jgi:fido (protein-threonine AMPylation protein)